MSEINDTICAVATGNNPGAISVIRVSGKDAKEIVSKNFSRDLRNAESHKSYFGLFLWKGEPLDEVLITFFQTGKSYTGEETVEIACHGSRYIQEKTLSILVEAG